jgi:hypothetical protein
MIALARCRAVCNICGVVKNQIDGTRERAERVVREAMEKHVAEDHPEHVIRPGPTTGREADDA